MQEGMRTRHGTGPTASSAPIEPLYATPQPAPQPAVEVTDARVERAAKAIAEKNQGHTKRVWDELEEDERDAYFAEARAALTAALQPEKRHG